MMRMEHVWYVYTAGRVYLGGIRGATENDALAAARERWLAEDPLPWQYPIDTILEVRRTA